MVGFSGNQFETPLQRAKRAGARELALGKKTDDIALFQSLDDFADGLQRMIEADGLVYQDIEAMKRSVQELGPHLKSFEASCFDGLYITGDVTPEYLDKLEAARELAAGGDGEPKSQLNLNLAGAE